MPGNRTGSAFALSLCVALFAGMALTQSGFGEESGAAASGHSGGLGSAGDQGGARPAANSDAKSNDAGEGTGGAKDGNKDGNSSAHNGNTPGDTPGDVGPPSRGANGKSDKAALPNTAWSLRNAHRRTFHPSKVVTAPARNSIGVALPQNESVVRNNNAHPGNGLTSHPVVDNGTGGAVSTKRFTKIEGSSTVPVPNSTPTKKPIVPNRGAINGSNVNRAGAASAQLGGPAKTNSGLSGPGIRPRY